jgi:hypothetical protein
VNPKLGVHAIFRHDQGSADVTLGIAVVAVVPTREQADRKVERLQEINRDTGCRYFWTPIRHYPKDAASKRRVHDKPERAVRGVSGKRDQVSRVAGSGPLALLESGGSGRTSR